MDQGWDARYNSGCFANLDRIDAVLAEAGVDAVVAAAPENVTYLSGFWAMTHWIRRGPQAYVFWPRGGADAASIITGTGTLDLVADQSPWVTNVRRFGFFAFEGVERADLGPVDKRQAELYATHEFSGPVEALVDAIVEAGLQRGRIAIDEIGMTPQCLAELREKLPDLRIEHAFELLREMRTIKTPEEIRRLRRACNIAEAAIDASLAAAHEGMTEREMARIFHGVTVRNDAEPVLGCIGFGARSALVNAQPSDAKLRLGDVIRFDVGGRFKHYRADISRIGVLGEPSRKVMNTYSALRAGVEHAHEIIRPGLTTGELFSSVMDVVQRSGLPHYRRSHVGHGIGIDGYDAPSLAPGGDRPLEPGMVLCVETPYYEFGLGGLQVEDMVVVTEGGSESLMVSDSALRVIPA